MNPDKISEATEEAPTRQPEMKTVRRKLIIDSDLGCDDCVAILAGLRDPHVDVCAITTIFGNVGVKQATDNAATLLQYFNIADVAIYEGAAGALLDGCCPKGWAGHGKNGMGDSTFESTNPRPKVLGGHAAQVLTELVSNNPGEYELVCLGPLTNIAMAIRLEPSFVSNIKKITIMGGSIHGKGNTSISAEFNIHSDPEAAHIVISSFDSTKLQMLPWEVTEKHSFSWPQAKKLFLASKAGDFVRKVNAAYIKAEGIDLDDDEALAKTKSLWNPCDAFAMAMAIGDCEQLSIKTKAMRTVVELAGNHSRGTTHHDWYDYHGEKLGSPNATVCVDMPGEGFPNWLAKLLAD